MSKFLNIFSNRKCIDGTQIQLRFTKHFHGWSKSLNQHWPLHHPPDAWLWLSCGWSSTELISCFNLVIHSGAMLENRGPLSCHPSSMVWWWLVVHSGCLVHCLFMPLSKIIQIQELGKSCVDKQTLLMLSPANILPPISAQTLFELWTFALGCLLFLRPKHPTPMNEQPTPIFIEAFTLLETLGITIKKFKEIS
jgi:hypothetical protein